MKEKLARWIAWRLPRRIVYWAAIRLFTYASSKEHKNVEVGRITVLAALAFWRKDKLD